MADNVLEGLFERPEIEDALPRAVVSELARIVLSTETLDSVLSRVAELCKKVVVGADEVSLTLVRAGRAATAAYTAELAMQADERQYGLDGGPCLDAGRGGELMHIVDMRTEDRWPDYSPLAVQVGVLSSLSIPLPIQEEVVGAVNIYARKPDAFAEEALAAGRAIPSPTSRTLRMFFTCAAGSPRTSAPPRSWRAPS